MRTILYLIRKEFIQIFRNRTMLPIIFVVPLVQLIILVSAATLEMKSIDVAVVDLDQSTLSRGLVNKFRGSPFFRMSAYTFSRKEAEAMLVHDRADMVIVIPQGMERHLYRSLMQQEAHPAGRVQLLVNAINATAAGLINAYAGSIIRNYMMAETAGAGMGSNMATVQQVDISYSFWYNPELNYQVFMLPGILVILVTIIGMFLPALNLVREKEIGTIEQINVSPIKKYQFIAGKLVPFLIIGLFELSFGLAFGKLVYAIPLEGNLLLLFGFASVYLMAALGMGLFISASSSNQQQVMFMSFFFLLTFILMSGIFTPVESMPHWASWVNIVNPFAYFMKVIRMVLLKGSTFADIRHEFFSMLLFAAGILSLAVWRYRKIA